jgi:hypothetical protein
MRESTRQWTRRGVLLMMSTMSIGMMGCATVAGKTEHSVVLRNRSTEDVFEVQVLYGAFRFPDEPEGKISALAASQYNDRLEVPEEAKVAWRTKDRQQHLVTVPIRRHVPDAATFGGKIEFQINGAKLQVFVARRTPRYTFDRQQIY